MKIITGIFIIIMLALPFYFFVGDFIYDVIFDTQTPEEKNLLCFESCSEDGWDHGEWIGYRYCNCFNSTIINHGSRSSDNKSEDEE